MSIFSSKRMSIFSRLSCGGALEIDISADVAEDTLDKGAVVR
jgi:hypothetical protein